MMESNVQKHRFGFDLGRAFPVLTSYLETRDKLSLASSCQLLRSIVLQANSWHQFSIQDHCTSEQWMGLLSWAHKYIDLIQPHSLSLSILNQQNEHDQQLLKLLAKSRPYITKAEIRCESLLLHLAVAHCCPQLTSITLHSAQTSDQLLQNMVKQCPGINNIEINTDSLGFTGVNMASYLQVPLERLVLKPYQLDYEAILRLLLNQELNLIGQLQIDVEECSEHLLSRITSHLPHARKLRLYHMEKFEDDKLLAQHLSGEMLELSLTKCYNLRFGNLIPKIVSGHLQKLDLTEAVHLEDSQLLQIAVHGQLRFLNVSWCNELTNHSLRILIQKCLGLESLIINGIKALSDEAFQDYSQMKPVFDQKLYDSIRFDFKRLSKKHKPSSLYDTLEKRLEPGLVGLGKSDSLRNLRHLECNSCNNISDAVLKIIYCCNRMAKVINYYGEVLSLYHTSQLSDDGYA